MHFKMWTILSKTWSYEVLDGIINYNDASKGAQEEKQEECWWICFIVKSYNDFRLTEMPAMVALENKS